MSMLCVEFSNDHMQADVTDTSFETLTKQLDLIQTESEEIFEIRCH